MRTPSKILLRLTPPDLRRSGQARRAHGTGPRRRAPISDFNYLHSAGLRP